MEDNPLYVVPPEADKLAILAKALEQQAEFLEKLDRCETGWWDGNAMADAKAAIWNALEAVR